MHWGPLKSSDRGMGHGAMGRVHGRQAVEGMGAMRWTWEGCMGGRACAGAL